jgi:pimeloyl-ACP methyl ester carboxylesterase
LVVDSYVDRWPDDMLKQIVAQRQNPEPGLQAFWQAAHGHDWAQVVACDSELLSKFSDTGLEIMGKRLAQIKAPVLFTLSENDADLAQPLKQLSEMTRLMPNFRQEVFKEGSHPSIWTCPDLFRPLVKDFLIAHSD